MGRATTQSAVRHDHRARCGLVGAAQRRTSRRCGRCGRHGHLPALVSGRDLACDRCTLAGHRIGRPLGRIPGFLCAGHPRTPARLLIDARRLGVGFSQQERHRLDGPGHGHHRPRHLGEALAGTPALGTVLGIGPAGRDDFHLDLVRIRGAGRHGAIESVFLEQFGRPIHSRRCAERNPIRGRSSQFAWEIPDRVAALPLSLDLVGHRRPAPCVAAAQDSVRRVSPGAVRSRCLAAGVGNSFPGRDCAEYLFCPGTARCRFAARLVVAGNFCGRVPLGSARVARDRRAAVDRGDRSHRSVGLDRRRRLGHDEFGGRLHRDLRGRFDRCRGARASCLDGGARSSPACIVVAVLGLLCAARGAGITGVPGGRFLAGLGVDRSRHTARCVRQAFDPVCTGRDYSGDDRHVLADHRRPDTRADRRNRRWPPEGGCRRCTR